MLCVCKMAVQPYIGYFKCNVYSIVMDITKTMWINITTISLYVLSRNGISYNIKYHALENILEGLVCLAVYQVLPAVRTCWQLLYIT